NFIGEGIRDLLDPREHAPRLAVRLRGRPPIICAYPWGMELRHLRYFVTVAAELHFARAAQRLFISQPALSQQVRSLEGELGFKLLERNSRGVQLTPEGQAFLAEAQIVVRDADHAAEGARALAQGGTGHLRLSHLRTMPRGLPERVVSEYQRRYPSVEIIPDY